MTGGKKYKKSKRKSRKHRGANGDDTPATVAYPSSPQHPTDYTSTATDLGFPGLDQYGSNMGGKSYKGGQARWPAPFNPAPPHPLPSVGCRFPNFKPLVLSQFGGTKSKSRCAGARRYKKRKSRKARKSRKSKKSRKSRKSRKYKR